MDDLPALVPGGSLEERRARIIASVYLKVQCVLENLENMNRERERQINAGIEATYMTAEYVANNTNVEIVVTKSNAEDGATKSNAGGNREVSQNDANKME